MSLRYERPYYIIYMIFLLVVILTVKDAAAQIPLEQVLRKITVPSDNDLRGLVDIVGFPQTAEQMNYIGKTSDDHERTAISENQKKYSLDNTTALICGISPHDDYTLASYVYAHIHRYIKAKTVILIGNAHWSEAFGIRNTLIFGDFKYWRGPYGPVKVSDVQEQLLKKLKPASFTVNRSAAETEHSLEAQIPFLQYYNRNVEIIPIFIPYTDWNTMQTLGEELSTVAADIMRQNNWKLGTDVAILISTDGQHYGDYGWSYYNYHPYGCDADGYKKATSLDSTLIRNYLTGAITSQKILGFFSNVVDQANISNFKITWCGRFAIPFGLNFASLLAKKYENKQLTGCLLRCGTSISEQWLDLTRFKLGLTGDANLHHFVTYTAIGYK